MAKWLTRLSTAVSAIAFVWTLYLLIQSLEAADRIAIAKTSQERDVAIATCTSLLSNAFTLALASTVLMLIPHIVRALFRSSQK